MLIDPCQCVQIETDEERAARRAAKKERKDAKRARLASEGPSSVVGP